MRFRTLTDDVFWRMLGAPWRNRGFVMIALVSCILLVTDRVQGEEAVYHLVDGNLPVSTASHGFVQEVRLSDAGGVEVYVATSLAPIRATGSYGGVLSGDVPDVPVDFVLPRNIADQLRPDLTSWEAATLVLSWVFDRVEIDTSDTGPQDAVSVLDKGRGRCSGLANASVAMLLAAGFEARTVSGLLIGDDEAIPHRWLECRLPGAGWVASDPTLGLWTVTPRHVVFSDTVMAVPDVRVVTSNGDGLGRLPRRAGA